MMAAGASARTPRLAAGVDLVGPRERLVDIGVPVGVLAAISLAEVVTAMVSAGLGLILHAGIVLVLLWLGARTTQQDQRGLLFALVVLPLIRIFSLCLPLNGLPLIYWYPAIMAPVLVSVALAARTQHYSLQDIGLTSSGLGLGWLSLLLAPLGLALGVAEYVILKPQPLTRDASAPPCGASGLAGRCCT